MAPSRKQQVIDLLKSLETKDPVPLAYVNPNKYIQHNLQVGSGPAGVAALIKNMPPDASVNTIRVFEDGDYVFAHTQYNFFGPRIGFDIWPCVSLSARASPTCSSNSHPIPNCSSTRPAFISSNCIAIPKGFTTWRNAGCRIPP